MNKFGIFSCAGVGDCLLILILAENLRLNGHEVTVFHPFMHEMQSWFPHVPIRPFPPNYADFDRFIVVYEKSPWMQHTLQRCLLHFRSQTIVLNPIATPNHDYPYWEEGQFDGRFPFADNLISFCHHTLHLQSPQKTNGLTLPTDLIPRSHPKQIAIHPTSSRPGKNWPKHKFLKLSHALTKQGFQPVFIVSPQEHSIWPEAPLFQNLDAMARCVASSAFFIGNDSGIGHLASSCGLPTLSLFKNSRTADFWKPSFALNISLTPKGWLPNLKGMRWRDTRWHWGISLRRVLQAFDELQLGSVVN